MSREKILIIEDEKDLVKLLKYNLEKAGFDVVAAHDGESGLALLRKEKPSLVVLDIMLPKMDGFEVCKAIRQDAKVPILMLTAKREELDKIIGLELGADDYVTKPFSVREVIARIKAITRRASESQTERSLIRVGHLTIDLEGHDILIQGKSIRLSPKEFELLKTLVKAKGRALSREKLLDEVWGIEDSMNIDTRTVDQHVARMREKLGPEGTRIMTVQNLGYRFKAD